MAADIVAPEIAAQGKDFFPFLLLKHGNACHQFDLLFIKHLAAPSIRLPKALPTQRLAAARNTSSYCNIYSASLRVVMPNFYKIVMKVQKKTKGLSLNYVFRTAPYFTIL